MPKHSELYREARRCADMASRGVSPVMSHGLAAFYQTLAEKGAKDGLAAKLDEKTKRGPRSKKLR